MHFPEKTETVYVVISKNDIAVEIFILLLGIVFPVLLV